MRTINIFMPGRLYDDVCVEQIKAQVGSAFVAIKLLPDDEGVTESAWLTVRGTDEALFKILFDSGSLKDGSDPNDDITWPGLASEMPASWPEEMKRDYYLSQLEESPANQDANRARLRKEFAGEGRSF